MNSIRFHEIEVGGFRGRYAVLGRPTRSPILMVAGALVRGETYEQTARELARFQTTCIVELPGSGSSEHLSQPWELHDYARWLAQFIDGLGWQETIVIGHSHSAGISLLLPVLFPGRAGALVIADGIGAGGPFSFWRVAAGRTLDTFFLELRLGLRAWHHVAWKAIYHSDNYFHQIRLSLDANLIGDLSAIEIPVLLAWGRWDLTTPVWCMRLLEARLPNASSYISPTGSHAWVITHAREFANVVNGWCDH